MGMDVYGKKEGSYFRASCWSWRPINALAVEVNQDKNLGLDLTGWEYNDGAGLRTQEKCDKLAAAMEEHVNAGRKEYVLMTSHEVRVDDSGRFLRDNEPGGKSPYSADAEHVLEFVKFLRECGGSFEIW